MTMKFQNFFRYISFKSKAIHPKFSKKKTYTLTVMLLAGGLGWFKNPVSSQTEKLMAGTKFSDYLGLNHYRNAKKLKKFIHFHFTYRPQSFGS